MVKTYGKEIKNVFTYGNQVKAIYSYGEKVWSLEPEGDWTLIEDEYIEDVNGYYHQKLVMYGGLIPGVTYETPISTTYNWIEDTESTITRQDGYVYLMSNNKGINNSYAQVKLSWEDIPDFTLYYRSYAETSYDYVVVSKVDADPYTSLPSDSGSLVNTKSKQSATEFQSVNLSGSGKHHLYVAFRKDSSTSTNKDRGYIYFKGDTQEIKDTKAGDLLPYEFVYYGSFITEGDKYYQKLIYTATLPNGNSVKNENIYVKGEEVLKNSWVIKDWGDTYPTVGCDVYNVISKNICRCVNPDGSLILVNGKWQTDTKTSGYMSSGSYGRYIYKHPSKDVMYLFGGNALSKKYLTFDNIYYWGAALVSGDGSTNAHYGNRFWDDNDGNVYYSGGSEQYVVTIPDESNLGKPNFTKTTWNIEFSGFNVWKANGDVYMNSYKLVDGEWVNVDLGFGSIQGQYVWEDYDGHIYYSDGNKQYEFINGRWETKVWNGLIPESGKNVWKDYDGHLYYSDGNKQYVFLT